MSWAEEGIPLVKVFAGVWGAPKTMQNAAAPRDIKRQYVLAPLGIDHCPGDVLRLLPFPATDLGAAPFANGNSDELARILVDVQADPVYVHH